MDRCTFDYIDEIFQKLYDKLEGSFSLSFSDDEINMFKKKIGHLSARLYQMEELNGILCDVHNEIIDLQQFLANHKPPEENEEDKKEVPGLQKTTFQPSNHSHHHHQKAAQKQQAAKSSPLLSSATSPNQPTHGTTRLTKRQKQFFCS